ncbi:MAG TPA: DEAD/DEAH box helicase [Gemmatimonadaceae bacterium]|nr:DEAD/DEAH box helicase [Gemmatimonadaceae bacterium]
MHGHLIERPATIVRATVARAWLAAADGGSPLLALDTSISSITHDARRVLGAITLRPHQFDAAGRLAASIDRYGGALLADEVGLGKTYTALAVARDAARLVVVAPAALRDMWRAALRATEMSAAVTTFERLSRAGDDDVERRADFAIVDEAHHARNPATRRYHALARLTDGARVLLLTATPIHNRRADLDALLALFLGARARTLDAPDLALLVVRRGPAAAKVALGSDDGLRLPSVAHVVWLHPPASDDIPEALLSLPPPVPPRDGGDATALVLHSLVRQWASSVAALRAAIARRLAAAGALADSLARGRLPTCADLRLWAVGDDAVQLAFPDLLVDDAPVADAASLLAAVREHRAALRALDRRLREPAAHDADDARASLMADIARRHAGEKVVAFASYAETVAALFGRLRHRTRVAALTGGGALVAGGRITRRQALTRFAPHASGAPPPPDCDRVDLLLTTDLLSEGVNLQDASVVVHLDLPWTPARLEQRVGRAARLGALRSRVHVYAVAPPATAECVLRVESRLRTKARVAGAVVGAPTAPSPFGGECAAARSAPGDAERTRAAMREWLNTGGAEFGRPSDDVTLVAAVRAPRDGWLALCDSGRGGAYSVVASLGGGPPADSPDVLHDAVALAGGPDVPVDGARTARALAAIRGWASSRVSAEDAGVGGAGSDIVARRRVLDRLAAVARRAPHHRRAAVAALCHDAGRVALLRLGAAAESRLDLLARSAMPDDAWVDAVRAFVAEHEPSDVATRSARGDAADLHVVALLHLVADL